MEFKITQLANGWTLTKDDQPAWFYPSMDLILKQLSAYTVPGRTVDRDEGSFRKGGSQIDIEEVIRDSENEGQRAYLRGLTR
jgi:hypothetical protein